MVSMFAYSYVFLIFAFTLHQPKCFFNIAGFPLILQADPGTENSDMGAIQCTLRHEAGDCFSGLNSFRVVKSTFNQVNIFFLFFGIKILLHKIRLKLIIHRCWI